MIALCRRRSPHFLEQSQEIAPEDLFHVVFRVVALAQALRDVGKLIRTPSPRSDVDDFKKFCLGVKEVVELNGIEPSAS